MFKNFTAWAVISLITLSYAYAEEHKAPDERPTLTVNTTYPVTTRLANQFSASGSIAPKQTVQVATQVPGLILNEVYANIGDKVRKGQLLALYDITAVNNDISNAQAQLTKATLQSQHAQLEAKKARKLSKKRAMSEQEANNYILRAKQAQADVQSAQSQLQSQLLRKEYAHARAPEAGIITHKTAVRGSIGAMGAQLFSILVDGALEWQADVPSRYLASLDIGTPVKISLQHVDPLTSRTSTTIIDGVVRVIAPTIDAQSGNARILVSLPQHQQLRSGMFTQGSFITGYKETTLIPTSSILRKDGFTYIFTVNENNRVSRMKVALGNTHQDSITVLQDLPKDELIVTSGVSFLENGDIVEISH